MKASKGFKSNFFLILAAVIWGFAFVAQCDAADKIDIFLLIGIRYILGGLSLLPIIFLFENRQERKMKKPPKLKTTCIFGLICGTVLFIASSLQQLGINMNPSASKAGFITGTYTVIVPVLSLLIFRKKTSFNVWIGVACAVIGLYLLSVDGSFGGIMLSDGLLLLCALFFAGHILCVDRCIGYVSAIKLACIQFFVCGIWGLLIVALRGNIDISLAFSQIFSAVFPILFMGICSSGIAYTCQILGQKDANPTYAAIILSAESVFAALGGAIFATDTEMNFRKYLGCAVIFVGIIISQFSPNFSARKNKNGSV